MEAIAVVQARDLMSTQDGLFSEEGRMERARVEFTASSPSSSWNYVFGLINLSGGLKDGKNDQDLVVYFIKWVANFHVQYRFRAMYIPPGLFKEDDASPLNEEGTILLSYLFAYLRKVIPYLGTEEICVH